MVVRRLINSISGTRLEVFKFGIYVFFPIAISMWIGSPEWYLKHVDHLRTSFNPPRSMCSDVPTTTEDVRERVAAMMAARKARREAALALAGISDEKVPSTAEQQ